MDTTRIYNTARASIGTSVVIWPRAAAASLDADRGGKLTFPGGTVNFPARSLVDEQGRAISGKVNVSFSTLNVADGAQIRSAPGDFTARMPDNRIRQLETFGVFEVYVEDSCGRRVNLAPGQNATVELSIPQEIRRRTPSSVGLFSFDQNSGRWIPEGTLRLLPTRPFLTTPIRNVVVTWNADMLMDTTCLRVQVLDANNQPAPQGIRVEAEGFNYTGISPTSYTDASGVACLLVKKSAQAIVTAYDPNAPDIQSCPETFQTSNTTLDCSNPSLCPMGTPSIKISGGYFLDELNSYDTTRWYESNGTNYDPNDPTNPFNVCWDPTHISFSCCPSLMTIALDNTTCSLANHNLPYTSGEYQTRACYYYGKYEASIKAAKGGGLVTSFFTYTGPPMTAGHHEIDIEIKGNQDTGCPGGQTRTVMQANYYVKGVGNHEVPIDLCFDASAAFHTYAFEWRPNMIQWSVDGVVKYTVCNTSQCPSGGVIMTGPLPSLPGKIIVNFWAGNSNANAWLGGPFVYPGAPIQAQYDWIKYSP
jgi:beta-glucanase (GH16 family)